VLRDADIRAQPKAFLAIEKDRAALSTKMRRALYRKRCANRIIRYINGLSARFCGAAQK
jgi:hypothetical protein